MTVLLPCCSAFTKPPMLAAPRSSTSNNDRCRKVLQLSTDNVDLDCKKEKGTISNKSQQISLLSLKDILPISVQLLLCCLLAVLISTYEDFDVTHTRPNPSTLRRPTASTSRFNYVGAATKGMGWGISDRIPNSDEERRGRDDGDSEMSFEEGYGSSAATLQWKPSYNEVMLEHRRERVPRWINDKEMMTGGPSEISSTDASANATPNKAQIQQAVTQLYQALEELDELKAMSDNYQWDEMKELLHPISSGVDNDKHKESETRYALEYSMDVIKSFSPANEKTSTSISSTQNDYKELIGFDWGSCAWRHCGAKADGQEALAELYSSVGMLEPFECRFVIGE
jgi:hypothetical protein